MKPIMSYAVLAVLAVGGLASLFRLIRVKHYIKTPGLILAVLFFVSFLISLVMNLNYESSEGVKGVVWLGLHLFVLFAFDEKRSVEDYKKEFTYLSLFFTAVIFLMSFVSAIQYFARYSAVEYYDTHIYLSGLVLGRLWGLYRDPNYGSVFATIAIMFSVFYIRKFKNILLRTLFVINIMTQILYIAYSDSRTGIITLFLCAFVYSIFMLCRFFGNKKVLKTALSVVLSIVIGLGAAFTSPITQKISHGVENFINLSEIGSQNNGSTLDDSLDDDDESTSNSTTSEDLEIREEALKDDISNRRFDLWKSCTEIFLSKPVFGVSFYALKQYALAEMPETYLVNNGQSKFNNAHNFFFNVLAGQGLVGIVILLAFAVFAAYFIFKNISKIKDGDYEYICILITCMVAALVSGMFLADVVYVNSPTSIMFWLFLGYIFHYIKTQKKAVE
jgi:O-antigen ligase